MTQPLSSNGSTTPESPLRSSPEQPCCSPSSQQCCRQDAPPASTASESGTSAFDAVLSRTSSENDYSGDRSATIRMLTPHRDNRGNVRETFRASWFPQVPPIRQLVRSKSKPRTIRGMHLHRRQYDVWHFVAGAALVRTYDHLTGDDNYTWAGPGQTIAIPPGLSHGFYTPDGCTLLYALTEEYDGSDEFGWHFSDGVNLDREWADEWPTDPTGLNISERDMRAARLAEFCG